MGRDPNIPFLKLVHEVFDPLFLEYGFAVQEEEIWLQPETTVFARKDDIELSFCLGPTYLFWYFGIEIKLLGQLGTAATSDAKFRHLGVTTIAECLDQNYKENTKASQTESELRERMEYDKAELLRYCENILLGDVSNWQKVVDCLRKKRKKVLS